MREKFIVYKRTNKINGKVYIGITSRTPEERMRATYRNCHHMIHAIEKYGKDAFETEVLYSELTKEEACQKEINLISFYDSTNPEKGYNISKGGSAPMWGRKHSKETIEKLIEQNKGENNGFYGKHHDRLTMPNNTSVICLNTLKIYPSIALCGEQTGISAGNIQHATNCDQMCAGQNKNGEWLFWSKYDKEKDMDYYKKLFKKKKKEKEEWDFEHKSIIDLETLKIYQTSHEAAKALSCRVTMIYSACNGWKYTCKNHYLMYEEEYNKLSEKEKAEYLINLKCATQGNAVVCVNTGEFFKNSQLGGKKYGLYSGETITDCCNHTSPYAGTHPVTNDFLKWEFYDNYKNMTEEEKLALVKKPVKGHKPVRCINTGIIYRDAGTAAKIYNIHRTGIVSCCEKRYKHSGKDNNGISLKWEYIDEYPNGFIKPEQAIEVLKDKFGCKVLTYNLEEFEEEDEQN